MTDEQKSIDNNMKIKLIFTIELKLDNKSSSFLQMLFQKVLLIECFM